MAKSSDQTQFMGNDVLSQGIQHIGPQSWQTFGNRSLSEENVAPNMSRNSDDDNDDFDENNDRNKPPPSSSEPIYRTFEGNVIKHDNRVYKTKISSYNAERNKIKNAFNYNYSPGLCRFFFGFVFGVTAKVDFIIIIIFQF
jgi:hypothetical protein